MLIYGSFYVDDIAIRKYPRRISSTYPLRPLWLYGSIWDASSWATENGKYRADYRYQPFVDIREVDGKAVPMTSEKVSHFTA